MRALTWFKYSVCLGRMLHCALAQFPHFTDEQTEAAERRDLPQIFKLVVELGLEPLRALPITSLVLVLTCIFIYSLLLPSIITRLIAPMHESVCQ